MVILLGIRACKVPKETEPTASNNIRNWRATGSISDTGVVRAVLEKSWLMLPWRVTVPLVIIA